MPDMRIILFGVVLGVGLLGSCRVGPNYAPPNLEIPDHYAWADSEQNAPPQEPTRWWKRFNDSTLDALVSQATMDNFDLRIAVERIDQYQAAYGVAASDLYPDISALASYSRARTPGTDVDSFGTSLGGDPYNSWTLGLDASWEIDLFGRIARSIEAAQGDLQAIIEDWRYALVTVRAEVATTYIGLRTLEERLRILETSLEAQQKFVDLLERQFEAGTTTESQVAQAKAVLESDRALVPELGAMLAEQVSSLAVLLGMTPGELSEMLPLQHGIPSPPKHIAVGIPSDLIRRRPDIRAAERNLAAATARIGEAEAMLYPQLSLSGNFGFGASSFSDLFNWSSRAYSAGPSFSWNFFNGDRLKSLVNQQESVTRQALLSYEQTMIQAIGEVESGLVGFVLAAKQRDAMEKAVGQNRLSYELLRQQYDQGVINLLDVLTAEQNLLSAEDSLAQAHGQTAESLVTLYRALGGGWTPESLPALASETKEPSS